MILTCPACGTRYQMRDDAFGNMPRTVRCTRCKHEWTEYPVAAPLTPVTESAATSGPASQPQTAPIAPTPTADEPMVFTRRTPERAAQQRGYVALLVAGLMVVAVLGGLVILSGPVMQAFPQSKPLYTMLGLARVEEKVAFDGLEVANVTRELEDLNGLTSLVFRGQVRNTTTQDLPVPLVEVKLFDEKGVMLDYWKVQPNQSSLAPGASTGWACRFYDAPVDKIASYTATLVE